MKNVFIVIFTMILASGCHTQKTTEKVDYQDTTENRNVEQRKGSGPPSIDDTFKMDVNNDGKLDKSEVKGHLIENFAKIDSNSDGFITRAELKNAPRPSRGKRPARGQKPRK